MIDTRAQQNRSNGVVIGFVAGGLIGAGLALYVAPRVAEELRTRYRQVITRVGAAVDVLSRKGDSARDSLCDTVVSGAREVERYATAAKSS